MKINRIMRKERSRRSFNDTIPSTGSSKGQTAQRCNRPRRDEARHIRAVLAPRGSGYCGGHGLVAKLAHLHPVALLLQEEGAIQHQPEFQRATKQVTYQLHAGDIAIARLPFARNPAYSRPVGNTSPFRSAAQPQKSSKVPVSRLFCMLGTGRYSSTRAPGAAGSQSQPPGYLLFTQAGDAGAAGDRLLQRQLQIALGKLHTGFGRAGERAVVAGADQVITAGERVTPSAPRAATCSIRWVCSSPQACSAMA